MCGIVGYIGQQAGARARHVPAPGPRTDALDSAVVDIREFSQLRIKIFSKWEENFYREAAKNAKEILSLDIKER